MPWVSRTRIHFLLTEGVAKRPGGANSDAVFLTVAFPVTIGLRIGSQVI